MYDKPVWYLGDFEFPIHWLVLLGCGIVTLLLALHLCRKRSFPAGQACLYGAIAAALGFVIGRGVYCIICYEDIFMDEMGEFAGLWRFFDSTVGSVNVMGFVAGILLAAPVTAALTKRKAAEYLDMAVAPALVMYILARAVEPLSGQGVGDFIEMEVCVSHIEAALTAILLAFVPFLRGKSRKPGTLFQYVLTLWCLAQILPESLRLDDSLSVFVFARVTHLGLAVTIGVVFITQLVKWAIRVNNLNINKREYGLFVIWFIVQIILFVCGLGLAIGTIFALDKTNLPKLLVYAAMVLSFVELGFVICRRIHKEDVR